MRKIVSAYKKDPFLGNLLFDDYFKNTVISLQNGWRTLISRGLFSGIPLPCMTAGLTYFDGLRTENSTANLIQAQRDFFGAHTYERTDADSGVFFPYRLEKFLIVKIKVWNYGKSGCSNVTDFWSFG